MSEQDTDLKQFWAQVIVEVKKGDINLSLWEALENAVPITIEGDTLALGFAPVNMKHSGYINNPSNQGIVRRAIEAAIGRRLNIEFIEGETLDAWERYKQRKQAREGTAKDATRVTIHHKGALAGWQELGRQIRELYYKIGGREQPLNHARFLIKALPLIHETEQQMRALDDNEDLHEIELNKTLERIASFCQIPGGLIALEYLRYKGSRKKA
jgi:hypothetical protein